MVRSALGLRDPTISVLVPVLNRPHRVEPLVASVRAAAKATRCQTVFLCSPGDDAQIAACHAAEQASDGDVAVYVMPFPTGPGNWAMKINYGLKTTEAPFVFTGADDLHFHPGWAERALACHMETGACVIGTNDLGHTGTMQGTHSTHLLVCREYAECGTIDEPSSEKIVHEGYGHWQPDAELVATAKFRRTYAHAADSLVEHLHPNWQKAADDSTYRKGQATMQQDRALFNRRKHLWDAQRQPRG